MFDNPAPTRTQKFPNMKLPTNLSDRESPHRNLENSNKKFQILRLNILSYRCSSTLT